MAGTNDLHTIAFAPRYEYHTDTNTAVHMQDAQLIYSNGYMWRQMYRILQKGWLDCLQRLQGAPG